MRGTNDKALPSDYGMLLNGMQVIEQDGTPKNEMQKEK